MNSLKKFLKINRATIVAVLVILFLGVMTYELNVNNKLLNQNKEFAHTINMLDEEVESLQNQLNVNNEYIKVLEDKNDELSNKNIEYKNELIDCESKLEKYQKEDKISKSSSSGVSSLDTGFRSWMPYTALRSGTSQYKVVHMASANKYGILEYKERAVVAVGFGWGLKIGDTATVTTTNGTYKIVVGDWKARCDTDNSNKVTTSNGCVVEFIVDRNSLDQRIKTSGSVASINKYSGKVLDIVSDGSNILK